MFTGLIQAVGCVTAITPNGSGRRISIDLSALAKLPPSGASVAICGVCLTVTELAGRVARFDAVCETISRSNLGLLQAGDLVNLEPALCVGDPLDGHIVQGHVDATGEVLSIEPEAGSWQFRFSLPDTIAPLVAEKGSIAVDGISLTVVAAGRDFFSVAIIPHTMEQTTLGNRKPGDRINLEVDVLARYAARRAEWSAGSSGITAATLRENGFI